MNFGSARRTAFAALTAVAIAPSSPIFAHGSKLGNIVHAHEQTRPVANPGYKAPAPETLGGPFEMLDHTGRTVTDKSYAGKWRLMFFGHAGCREACPVGLDRMTLALEQLGVQAGLIQPLFVDIAMEEPDVKGLTQFVSNFHPSLVGLTGSRAQRLNMMRTFKIQRQYAHEGYGIKETGPRIDHSTYFFLIDPQGTTRTFFYHTLTPEQMVNTLRKYL